MSTASKEEIALAMTVLETVREGTHTMEELQETVRVADDLLLMSQQTGIPLALILDSLVDMVDNTVGEEEE